MKNLIFCAMVNISFHIIVMVSVKPKSSRADVKKRSSGNLAKFTGKHSCQSLFFNIVASLRPCKF